MKHHLAPLLVLALGACATMSKDECRNADWRTIGVEDGASGRLVSNIGRYREACARHGVTPNLEEYQSGHATGARNFCTPSNGFAKGRAGANGYENFCPLDVAAPFVEAYESGRKVHAADQRVNRARQALADVVDEIDTIDETIIEYTGLIAGKDTPAPERVRLAKDLVELGTRRTTLTIDRPRHEREVSAAEAHLARMLHEAGQ